MGKPKSKVKIIGSLEKKGFRATRMKKHTHYVYFDLHNNPSVINTSVSHGSKKDFGPPIISFMAKELKLSNHQFCQFIDCDISQEQYESILKSSNFLK
jgi:hypothetical protein